MSDQPTAAISAADRYLRGAVGMGLTWAVGWSVIAPLLDVFEWLFQGGTAPNMSILIVGPMFGAIIGFIGGGVFSVALAVARCMIAISTSALSPGTRTQRPGSVTSITSPVDLVGSSPT